MSWTRVQDGLPSIPDGIRDVEVIVRGVMAWGEMWHGYAIFSNRRCLASPYFTMKWSDVNYVAASPDWIGGIVQITHWHPIIELPRSNSDEVLSPECIEAARVIHAKFPPAKHP